MRLSSGHAAALRYSIWSGEGGYDVYYELGWVVEWVLLSYSPHVS